MNQKTLLYFKPKDEYFIPISEKHSRLWKVEKIVYKDKEIYINLRDTKSMTSIQVKQDTAVDKYVKYLIEKEMNINIFLNKVYNHPILDAVAEEKYGWKTCHIYKSNTGCKAVINSKLISNMIKDMKMEDLEAHTLLSKYFKSNYFNN